MTDLGRTVVITGALSYTGKYAARLLLKRGYQVRTLTFHPDRENPFGDEVKVFPYNFDNPEELRKSLQGASTLVNTYWVRFPHKGSTFESAVENTRILINAARSAGVERVVHVSIANPSITSALCYYKGKARLEQVVQSSGLSYAILRPTVIFGSEDILINNIAWFTRKFPFFCIPGNGQYRVQPIYVGDMADLIATAIAPKDCYTLDAAGPEIFTFEELVKTIGRAVGRPTRTVHLPAQVVFGFTRMAGLCVGDVILTWDEYRGLMDDLLVSSGEPTGGTRLSDWLAENKSTLGVRYASEVARHFQV